MENYSGLINEDDQLELPPGFRFHPTDEELITHYLSKKVVDSNFSARAIGEVDMNKVEPWDLPWRAKMGEKEWYFFCVRDKKYPTGLRTNRATAAGYWKATGKDKEIFRGKSLVGMKKTLVFYRGRAPKGEKTNWVTHEYRLEGKFSLLNLPKSAKNEWVICRVFQKTAGGKKVHISGLAQPNSLGNDLVLPSLLPPLMDSSPYSGNKSTLPESDHNHVHCFSNSSIAAHKSHGNHHQEEMFNYFNNHPGFAAAAGGGSGASSIPMDLYQRNHHHHPPPHTLFSWGGQPLISTPPVQGNSNSNYQISTSTLFPNPIQDNDDNNNNNTSILRTLLENCGQNMKQSFNKTEKERFSGSQETGLSTDINTEISSVVSNLEMGRKDHQQEPPSTTVGPQDLDCLWSY